MKKRLFLLFIIAMVLTGAQTVSATELGTGLKEPEAVGIPVKPIEEEVIDADREGETEAEATADADKWDAYASLYYYNQLSPEYRETWDALDVVCKSYFDESKTVTDANGYLNSVSVPDGMTLDELGMFWRMYIYSNPQYYFLKNSYSYSYAYGDETMTPISIRLAMYSAFYDGTARAEATAEVEAQLAAWQTEIDACATEAAKLRKIQDLICAKVTYNYDAANNLVDEQVSFSQSPYSLICGDSTVCAGYADTFSMLCNASGIDTISVTSSNHQWNKVRINDSWYNFDPTWDDNYTDSWGYPVYKYYGRSDAMYDTDIGSGSASNIAAHQEEDYWETYLPLCTLDSAPDNTFKVPGTFATISKQVATPEIAVSYRNGEMQVALGCATENAILYYTTDGTNPAVAKNKAYKYSEPFVSEIDTQIKAIAVCDTYLDSEVAAKVVELEKYAITYVLDGGVNSDENPGNYTVRDEVVLQAPTKTGYKFLGWHADEDCMQQKTGIEAGSTGPRTFYALWSPITYSISYDGNGATGGSMSDKTGCVYDMAYTLAENNYERTGYTYVGWNTQADGSGTGYADEASVKNLTTADGAKIILYAQWSPITYGIVFDGNGATDGDMEQQSGCVYDAEITLSLNEYENEGYGFGGWNTESDGSGTSYADASVVKNLAETYGETVTLYAQWKINTYTICYNGNKATKGSMASQSSLVYGKSYLLLPNKFKRTGYKFTGWNTQKGGKGTTYKNKTSVQNLSSVNGEVVTLYAQWKANTYRIKFNGNGATSGSMKKTKKISYGKKYRLSANKFKKDGYKFVGWNTKKNGKGKMYKNKAKIKNLTSKNGKTVTLYAQWKKI